MSASFNKFTPFSAPKIKADVDNASASMAEGAIAVQLHRLLRVDGDKGLTK
jgi:hypothetical protein